MPTLQGEIYNSLNYKCMETITIPMYNRTNSIKMTILPNYSINSV